MNFQKPYLKLISFLVLICFSPSSVGVTSADTEFLRACATSSNLAIKKLASSASRSEIRELLSKGFARFEKAPVAKSKLPSFQIDPTIALTSRTFRASSELRTGESSGKDIRFVDRLTLTNPIHTILVVEDEEYIRDAHQAITFRDLPAEIKIIYADDGSEALGYFVRNEKIDLLITDRDMPGMNGEELVNAVRATKNQVPVIVFSSPRELRDLTDSSNLVHIHKPNLALLREAVQLLVQKAAALTDPRSELRRGPIWDEHVSMVDAVTMIEKRNLPDKNLPVLVLNFDPHHDKFHFPNDPVDSATWASKLEDDGRAIVVTIPPSGLYYSQGGFRTYGGLRSPIGTLKRKFSDPDLDEYAFDGEAPTLHDVMIPLPSGQLVSIRDYPGPIVLSFDRDFFSFMESPFLGQGRSHIKYHVTPEDLRIQFDHLLNYLRENQIRVSDAFAFRSPRMMMGNGNLEYKNPLNQEWIHAFETEFLRFRQRLLNLPVSVNLIQSLNKDPDPLSEGLIDGADPFRINTAHVADPELNQPFVFRYVFLNYAFSPKDRFRNELETLITINPDGKSNYFPKPVTQIMRWRKTETGFEIDSRGNYEGFLLSYQRGVSGDKVRFDNGTWERHPAEEWRFLMDTARAVDELHKTGFVHRDLKPSNFIAWIENHHRHSRLIDFESSAPIDADISNRMELHWITQEYSEIDAWGKEDWRPEDSEIRDPRYGQSQNIWQITTNVSYDIFCLGMVFAEWIMDVNPTLLSRYDLTQSLASSPYKDIILKATELDRRKRYQSMDELIHDLEEVGRQFNFLSRSELRNGTFDILEMKPWQKNLIGKVRGIESQFKLAQTQEERLALMRAFHELLRSNQLSIVPRMEKWGNEKGLLFLEVPSFDTEIKQLPTLWYAFDDAKKREDNPKASASTELIRISTIGDESQDTKTATLGAWSSHDHLKPAFYAIYLSNESDQSDDLSKRSQGKQSNSHFFNLGAASLDEIFEPYYLLPNVLSAFAKNAVTSEDRADTLTLFAAGLDKGRHPAQTLMMGLIEKGLIGIPELLQLRRHGLAYMSKRALIFDRFFKRLFDHIFSGNQIAQDFKSVLDLLEGDEELLGAVVWYGLGWQPGDMLDQKKAQERLTLIEQADIVGAIKSFRFEQERKKGMTAERRDHWSRMISNVERELAFFKQKPLSNQARPQSQFSEEVIRRVRKLTDTLEVIFHLVPNIGEEATAEFISGMETYITAISEFEKKFPHNSKVIQFAAEMPFYLLEQKIMHEDPERYGEIVIKWVHWLSLMGEIALKKHASKDYQNLYPLKMSIGHISHLLVGFFVKWIGEEDERSLIESINGPHSFVSRVVLIETLISYYSRNPLTLIRTREQLNMVDEREGHRFSALLSRLNQFDDFEEVWKIVSNHLGYGPELEETVVQGPILRSIKDGRFIALNWTGRRFEQTTYTPRAGSELPGKLISRRQLNHANGVFTKLNNHELENTFFKNESGAILFFIPGLDDERERAIREHFGEMINHPFYGTYYSLFHPYYYLDASLLGEGKEDELIGQLVSILKEKRILLSLLSEDEIQELFIAPRTPAFSVKLDSLACRIHELLQRQDSVGKDEVNSTVLPSNLLKMSKGQFLLEYTLQGFVRPGFFGHDRKKIKKRLDGWFGEGNWEVKHLVDGKMISEDEAIQLYEDAYFEFFKTHPEVLNKLLRSARDVYDTAQSNVSSGFDYKKQETAGRHLHDIAIRNAVRRLRRSFNGRKLIQIRGRESAGFHLNPGVLPFHRPELITRPTLKSWWLPNTIEDFYQSTKVIILKKPSIEFKDAAVLKLAPFLSQGHISFSQVQSPFWFFDRTEFPKNMDLTPKKITQGDIKVVLEHVLEVLRKSGKTPQSLKMSLAVQEAQYWIKNVLSQNQSFPDLQFIDSHVRLLSDFNRAIQKTGATPIFLARDALLIYEFRNYLFQLTGNESPGFVLYQPGTLERDSISNREADSTLEYVVQTIDRIFAAALQELNSSDTATESMERIFFDKLAAAIQVDEKLRHYAEQMYKQFEKFSLGNDNPLVIVDTIATGKTALFIKFVIQYFGKQSGREFNVSVLLGRALLTYLGIPQLSDSGRETSNAFHDLHWPFRFERLDPQTGEPVFYVKTNLIKLLTLLYQSIAVYNAAVQASKKRRSETFSQRLKKVGFWSLLGGVALGGIYYAGAFDWYSAIKESMPHRTLFYWPAAILDAASGIIIWGISDATGQYLNQGKNIRWRQTGGVALGGIIQGLGTHLILNLPDHLPDLRTLNIPIISTNFAQGIFRTFVVLAGGAFVSLAFALITSKMRKVSKAEGYESSKEFGKTVDMLIFKFVFAPVKTYFVVNVFPLFIRVFSEQIWDFVTMIFSSYLMNRRDALFTPYLLRFLLKKYQPGSKTRTRYFNSPRAPKPVGAYPHARQIGNKLFLSGVGPRKLGTNQIPGGTLGQGGGIIKYDIEIQIRATFENVRMILEDAGSSWEELTDVQVFLTNPNDFQKFEELWNEKFPQNNPPQLKVTLVKALPTPIAFEMKATATLSKLSHDVNPKFIFLKGVSSVGAVDDSVEVEMRSAFESLRKAMIDAGLTWKDLIDIEASLATMRNFQVYNRLWSEYFPNLENQPTRTTVQVDGLSNALALNVVAARNETFQDSRSELRRLVSKPLPKKLLEFLGIHSELSLPAELKTSMIIGILPNLGRLPDLVDAIAKTIAGGHKIVVFVGTRREKQKYEKLLPKHLITSKQVVITTSMTKAAIFGDQKNAKLITFGIDGEDDEFAFDLERLLPDAEIELKLASVTEIETLLRISGISERARLEWRKRWVQAIAA